MLRILSLIIAVVIVIAGIIFGTGYNSSVSYQGEKVFDAPYSIDLVWQELLSFDETASRKDDVVSVETLEKVGKLVAWKENLKNGGYRIYRTNKRIDNTQLEIELTDSSYGLKGIWYFDLKQQDSYTKVFITEESTLDNVFIRGYRTFLGRDTDLLVWEKYIKVGLVQTLLTTP